MLDVDLVKALASDKRLLILDWLRDPERHFPPQRDGDKSIQRECSGNRESGRLGLTDAILCRCLVRLFDHDFR